MSQVEYQPPATTLAVTAANSLAPTALIRAQLRRETGAIGLAHLAHLAQDSLATIRSDARRLVGSVALHVLRPAGRHRAMTVQWAFHGWPAAAVDKVRQALSQSFAPGGPSNWQLTHVWHFRALFRANRPQTRMNAGSRFKSRLWCHNIL